MQSVYPGEPVNFSCRAKGFSSLSYSWFVTASWDADGAALNINSTTLTLSDPIYNNNNTGYFCIASNDEGIAVSDTVALIGNNCCVTVIS